MSQPQAPPYYPPPAPPQKHGLSPSAIIAIIAVVAVVIVVGAVIAGAFLASVQNAANLSEPNVALTDTHDYTTEDCGRYATNTTS